MQYLKENGFRTIDLDEFLQILSGQTAATGKEVLVTIDDGYRSIYEVAWPVFKKYHVPFVVFLSTQPVERGYASMMTWRQIEEMRAAGVVFGNHSHTHPHMGFPHSNESKEAYRARIRGDIEKARAVLKDHGISNRIFAYPYGEYNDTAKSVLSELGYDLAFSQNPGVAFAGADRLRVDRMAIVGENQTTEAFADKLSRQPLHAQLLEPSDTTHSGSISGIKVRIFEPENYEAGQINVFLSEKGRLQHQYDPAKGLITFPGPIFLERNLNRIIVTARERKSRRFGMMSWLVLASTMGPESEN